LSSFNEVEIKPGIIKEGVIQDQDALVKIIKEALNTVKGKRLNTKYVIASLPEEKSFLQIIQMPKMEEEELKSAVLFEAENYIPLPIDEVYLDFQKIAPIEDNLDHFDVLIVAMLKSIVDSYTLCLKKAGLIPSVLEVESQAIARALVKNETSTSPLILIDLGKNNTSLIIFSGHSIRFTCSIPVSSQQLTIAISEALGVDFAKAEKLKIGYDLFDKKETKQSKKILQALNPILEDLVTQIKKYMDFYRDHAFHEHLPPDGRSEKIILCGGGANLNGLPGFLSSKLGIPVELGNPGINFLSKQSNKTFRLGLKNFLPFTTALGLALRGVDVKFNY
jgi:type IV pilus assembly protein PilM